MDSNMTQEGILRKYVRDESHPRGYREQKTTGEETASEKKVLAQESGENWTLINDDCCEAIKAIPDESIHHSIYSPPFAQIYCYSDSQRDMGNCTNEHQFFHHFDFLISELLRVMKPGRCVCVHCMEMPRLKQNDGWIGVYDFRGDIVRHFEQAGFQYDGSTTIWKNPVTAMQRTKSIRLLHKQLVKDSSVSGWALPEYLCKFKKPGKNAEPIEGELDRWHGDDSLRSTGRLSIDVWQRYASPVWMDINPSNTLQYRAARSEADERHICPLSLDVVSRSIDLWSNEGDVVLTPFAGVGSEVYSAIKLNRRGIGIELKPSYFEHAVKNCRAAEEEMRHQRLF